MDRTLQQLAAIGFVAGNAGGVISVAADVPFKTGLVAAVVGGAALAVIGYAIRDAWRWVRG